MTNHGCIAITLKPKPSNTNGKGFAMIKELKEKIETEALGSDSRIEKNAGISVLYLWGVTLKRSR